MLDDAWGDEYRPARLQQQTMLSFDNGNVGLPTLDGMGQGGSCFMLS
jgi:hypothetical protein